MSEIWNLKNCPITLLNNMTKPSAKMKKCKKCGVKATEYSYCKKCIVEITAWATGEIKEYKKFIKMFKKKK